MIATGRSNAAQHVRSRVNDYPSVGIATPTLYPPLIAAAVGLLLGWRSIGADLMNLGEIRGLGAPVASIGGAGTYDGVFFTGILAVLLTWTPAQKRPRAADDDWRRGNA